MRLLIAFCTLAIAVCTATAQPVFRFTGSSTNGYVGTNDFGLIGIRNANHAASKTPILGFNSYSLNGNFGTTENSISNNGVFKILNTKSDRWYKWFNVDDAWSAGVFVTNGLGQVTGSPYPRLANGNLQMDTNRFPSGESGFLRLLHTNGFYGIKYLAVGGHTAGGFLGSAGHWYQDVTNSITLGWDGLRFAIDDTTIDTNEFVLTDTEYGLPFIRNCLAPIVNYSRLFHVNAISYNIHSWMQGAINEIQYSNYRFPDGTAWHDFDGGQTNCVNILEFYITERRSGIVQPGCYFAQMVMGTGYTGPDGAGVFYRGVNQNNRLFAMHAMVPMSIYPHDFDYDATYKYIQTNDYLLTIHQDPLVSPGQVIYSNGTVRAVMRKLAPEGSNRRALWIWNESYDTITNSVTITSSNLNIPAGKYLWTDVLNYSHFINFTNGITVAATNDQTFLWMITPIPTPYSVDVWRPLRNTTNGGAASNWFTGTNIYGQYIPTNDAAFAGLSWWSYNAMPPMRQLPVSDLLSLSTITNKTLVWEWKVMSTNRTPFKYTVQLDGWNQDNSVDTITGTSTGIIPSAGIWSITITNPCTKVYEHNAALFGSYTPDTGGCTNGTFLLDASVFRVP